MTLKPNDRNPEGYKDLLVYEKSAELQKLTNRFVRQFPDGKTMDDLADQMARSARSVKQNLVEGWKRNSTKEYYEFLGYSVGSCDELKEDYRDIFAGTYEGLKQVPVLWKGKDRAVWEWDEKGSKGKNGDEGVQKGSKGERKGDPARTGGARKVRYVEDIDLDDLQWHPLDESLPWTVRMYLRAKECNYLLEKLQQSLADKLDTDLDLSQKERIKQNRQASRKRQKDHLETLAANDQVKLKNGKIISKSEWEESGRPELADDFRKHIEKR